MTGDRWTSTNTMCDVVCHSYVHCACKAGWPCLHCSKKNALQQNQSPGMMMSSWMDRADSKVHASAKNADAKGFAPCMKTEFTSAATGRRKVKIMLVING